MMPGIHLFPTAPRRASRGWFAVLVCFCCFALPRVDAQQAGSEESETNRPSLHQLPRVLPDGRRLRAIGFYQSQIAELVPKDYQPVEIDAFRSAIAQLANRAMDDPTSRLKGSVYWIRLEDDTLVSDQSVIDIESYQGGIVQRSLGRVNLAILSPAASRGGVPSRETLPRLESAPDGNLVAVFNAETQVNHAIGFQWRLRGQVSGSGHEFALRLPPTPQTRIVLSTPSDVSVTAIDGVLHRLTSPPPDAVDLIAARDWYEIDAGGLDTVRIRTQTTDPVSEADRFIVRQSTVQYQVEPGGLSWTCRMLVQPLLNDPFPKLVVRGTTITSAEIGSADVRFSSETVGDRQQHLQLDVPRGLVDRQSPLVNVTLRGRSTWTNRSGWCDLPMPIWMGPQVLYASATDEAEVSLGDPLELLAWELPNDWRESTRDRSAGDPISYQASGPPIALFAESDESRGVTSQPNWSRIRLDERPANTNSETLLRIEEAEGTLSATARIALTVEPDRNEPLRLLIQSGWSVDAVTFTHSGRLVETAGFDESARYIDLWPEREDVDGNQLFVEVSGTRMIPSTSNVFIPQTWFARLEGVRGRVVAALLQPADFNWSGQSTLQRLGGPPEFLTESQLEFFSGTDNQTVWLRPTVGHTPRVELQTPTVSFNTTTLFQVFRDGDDITETVVVEVETQGQAIKQLAIDTGPTSGRPPLRWSISGMNGSPTTSIAPSDIEIGQSDRDGFYLIDVSDKLLRGRRLIGRRRYPIATQVLLPLPGVPGATSQQSEVHVGPGLLIKSKSRAAQRIPFGKLAAAKFSSYSPESLASMDLSQVSRLRYDAVEQPALTLVPLQTQQDVTVVWREQVRVIASSRGTDWIEAIYKVSPAAGLEIDYDPDLQVSSILRNGEPVDLITVPQRPIRLTAKGQTESVRIRWTRSQYQSGWLRRCRVPRIEASGTILRTEYELIAAADTFAPAALWRGRSANAKMSTVAIRPNTTVVLLRRNIALAFGWLVALLLFAFSWRIADRSPIRIAMVVMMLATVLFLWWPWRLAVIGWLIIPILAAALLASTQHWAQRRESESTSAKELAASHRKPSDVVSDFSLGNVVRLLLCGLLCAIAYMTAVGQESDAAATSDVAATPAPVNLLVPMDADGAVYGKMVYIPQQVKTEFFPRSAVRTSQYPNIESASYLLRLDSAINARDPVAGVLLEAEYILHLEPSELNKVEVQLPLPATTIRRIERVGDSGGLIPFKTTPDGQVVATLPKGSTFQLRVTLRPALSRVEQWTKLFLPIPPVAATKLTVESNQDIDAIRFGGATGNLMRETDLRRWVEELGAVDSLEVDFRPEAMATTESTPLQRRYWLNANAKQVSIDCEVDPPMAMAAGETFQFVVRDSRLPVVTSADWRLERSEQYTPTRRLMTFTSLRDNPSPVRLFWKSPLEFQEPSSPQSVRIPEVIAAALGDNAPAWVAIHADPSVRFLPVQNETTEALSVDHFLAAWSGYRSDIDRALVALTDLPSPQIERMPRTAAKTVQQQEVRVSQARIEIHYSAVVTPGTESGQRFSIRYPRSLQLIEVAVDNQPIATKPVRNGADNELPLGILRGTEPVSVKLVAIQSLTSATLSQRLPPLIDISPRAGSETEYTCSVFRDSSVNLQVVGDSENDVAVAGPELTTPLLLEGWIPVASWDHDTTSDSKGSAPQLAFDIRPNDNRFGCSQLISLNRSENQWEMEVLLGFLPNPTSELLANNSAAHVPDFIDVEIPTAWCDNLEVQPSSLTFVQRPATDSSRQILRIHCDRSQLQGSMISLTGRLQSSETGRVNVPAVQVLGAGTRHIYVDVPNRLDDESIQWRTSAVEAIDLPEIWDIPRADRSTYLVASPSWSIDLAPLPQDESGAIAFNADAQVFLREDGALLLCHWDFYPGNLETMRVRLPQDAVCLGAWSAGIATVPSVRTTSDSPQLRYLDLPLSISGLSQPVELLLKLPSAPSRTTSYLPELMGATVTQNWLVHYSPSTSESVLPLRLRDQQQLRALAMARGVVESIAAVSRVAQRPRDEVAAWLALWVKRYQMICRSVGRTVDLEQQSSMVTESTTSSGNSTSLGQSLPMHLQWKKLDAELASQLTRLHPPETPIASKDASEIVAASAGESIQFDVGAFEGFTPQQIMALSATNRPWPIASVSDEDRGLRSLLINILTLLLVGGLIICLRPLQHRCLPALTHPAFWLGLLAIFGFAVAPVAVAGALLLVAVTLPAFPSGR